MNINESWPMFLNKINALIQLHVPEKGKKQSKQPPSTTQHLLRLLRKKRRKWSVFKKYGNAEVYVDGYYAGLVSEDKK